MWQALNRIPRDWSTISAVRASFVSQALAAASLSIIILPKTGFVEWVFGNDWRYYVSLVGALLFIVGYLLPYFFATPEYRKARTRSEHLDYWLSVSSWGFFESHREDLGKLLERLERELPPDLPVGTKLNASANYSDSTEHSSTTNWQPIRGAMYDAELQLRAYDQHTSRSLTAVLLYSGIAIILSPNLLTFLCFILGFCEH